MRLLLLMAATLLSATAAHSATREQEVRVSVGNVTLAGTLTLPDGRSKAAVVLIQGAGPHTRNQVISGSPMFEELANALARLGVASVRVDNSGVGESTGARAAHFKERVPHLRAVLDALRQNSDLAGAPIGLVGHSEGSMVATELWPSRAGLIDFMVLLGAPGRQGRLVWVEQQSHPSRFPGKDPATIARIRVALERVADASVANDEALLSRAADHLFSVSGLTAAETADIRPGFISRMASEEMRVFLAHDPAVPFSTVTDPVLAVWGTHDRLTDPAQNAPKFLEHRNSSGSLTVMVLPNEDHFFLQGQGLQPGEHRRGQMHLSSRLPLVIADFVERVASESRRPAQS